MFTQTRYISLSHRISQTKIYCQPPPLVLIAYYASPYITRLVLCQTRARRAKDRSLQAGIGVHPLPAQGTRATLALRAYIMRKRPIHELSRFDAIFKPIAIYQTERISELPFLFFSSSYALYRFILETLLECFSRFFQEENKLHRQCIIKASIALIFHANAKVFIFRSRAKT